METERKYFLTSIMEGTAVRTVVGESRPRFILAYEGHHFDRDWNVVKTADWAADDPRWESLGIRLPTLTDVAFSRLGLYWIGIWPRKVVYEEREWTEWQVKPGVSKGPEAREICRRKEDTRYFLIKCFGYAFFDEDVETNMGYGVNIAYTVFVEGVNPKIALIDNDDWFEVLESAIKERVKNFVGGKSYFELFTEDPNAQSKVKTAHLMRQYLEKSGRVIPEPGSGGLPTFSEYLIGTQARRDGDMIPLEKALGVKIVDAKIESVELPLSSELKGELEKIDRQNIENLRSESEVDQQKKNIEKLAEAEANANAKRGKGEQERMNAVTQAMELRYTRVHAKYAETPRGAAIAIAELQREGTERIATAVEANRSLRTVVFPNSATAPVLPLSDEQDAGKQGQAGP